MAYAAYTETAIRLTEALTISPGIRWEQVNQSRETMNAIPPAALPNFKSYKTTQGLIYGTGVKYQLTPDSMLFGHVHTTFRPPTFANAVDPTSGTTQDLSAERALSSDIGVRSIIVPGVSAEVAVFRTEFSNQIVQQGSQFVNAGKTLQEGIESSLSLDWGEIVRPLQGFVTRANVTLLRPKSLFGATNGKDLPYAPRMTFYGLVGYYHPTGASIEADALFVAQQFTDGVNTQTENALGTTGAIPSYTIWNLRLNYAPPRPGGRSSPACAISPMNHSSRNARPAASSASSPAKSGIFTVAFHGDFSGIVQPTINSRKELRDDMEDIHWGIDGHPADGRAVGLPRSRPFCMG